eukprot:CAMPEP_0198139008 /NCGR_PEP_ID=MMETSP1443-20131203/2347_1 /TAXON_ID=186043 /ORGANISM="Entomoneis sp., Strain CCMP2396" /LENGTH=266 /DNA_ID=CAMNT_0043800977 /DNA_START=35 /DNA_END=835 /DNA_ORIENTATION=-
MNQFLTAILFLGWSSSAMGFSTVQPVHHTTTRSSSTSLHMATRRRDTLRWFRRALLGGISLSTVSEAGIKAAYAEEPASGGPGRTVVFTVDNLEGIEGNTGIFKVQLQPSWAPRGVDRFEELTSNGFWNNCRIFRVLPGFVVQFGVNGDPDTQSEWRSRNLRDDPVKVSNERGTVVFATAGKDSRTTQLFVNTRPQGNTFLDKQGFSPIGKVIEGMDVVDRMYAGYGEGAPSGKGPNQGLIQSKGNAYLKESFPKLSFISSGNFDS